MLALIHGLCTSQASVASSIVSISAAGLLSAGLSHAQAKLEAAINSRPLKVKAKDAIRILTRNKSAGKVENLGAKTQGVKDSRNKWRQYLFFHTISTPLLPRA